ncbi:hypothetical protein GOP47_0016664 [Adiantum capillus-veneris]|uniref:RING-type E3 ubiquitin transferase n=1 Tax=Adiantum capillus-veneris TaxID=13818 RepID=A0A9D4ZAX9_ADICA|nr:hypothetical protein GOP47_0016664 [Adiantum capillus-veneris]
MKLPACSICQTTYNDEEKAPMMLQCGHTFCKECLSRMFAVSTDHSLVCPRCRQASKVGNSVETLRKNFAMLSLINNAPSECTAEEASDEEDELTDCASNFFSDRSRSNTPQASPMWIPSCCGLYSGLGAHSVRLLHLMGKGPRLGQELWSGLLTGPGGCKHKVSVKSLQVPDGMDVDWVQGRLETLRRATMWCQNVCAFYGSCQQDGKLCIVMDSYCGSVQEKMQKNEGRLTLEQVLRYGADIARGMAELHAAGVVCMNLKPTNLLLDSTGRAVVADYGLPEILKKPNCRKARSSGSDDGAIRLHSCLECTMVSPHYIAPEAWEPLRKSALNIFGDDRVGISPESDVWSFGCVMVEMCTGAVPWSGSTVDEIYKAVVKGRRQPPQYAGVVGVGMPRELWKMIGECLQFKPSKRPTFSAMLCIFLRHLQDMPWSPPQSPEASFSKDSDSSGLKPSPSSVLEFVEDVQTSLHNLVSEGDVEGVRSLLARAAAGKAGCSLGTILDSRNEGGQTPLHVAVMRGYLEIVKVILEYPEADVEALDKDGDPPMLFSLACGTTECLKALIARGADVNVRLKEGLGPTIAHMCASYGEPECMQVLLSAGADANTVDNEGKTILHRAIETMHTACALVILENGGCKSMGVLDEDDMTPLHLCITTKNVAVVQKWVELAEKEERKVVLEIPSRTGTALCMAAALKKAHEAEARQLVNLLLSAGADGCAKEIQRGFTAAHSAAFANDAKMLKMLLDFGVDVNIRDARNAIPLHVALARGSKQCVKLLLEREADCNLQDDEGCNALHIASSSAKMVRDNLDWMTVMLGIGGVNIDTRTYSGKIFKDFLEMLPREWLSEDLLEALSNRGIQLTAVMYEPGDWVKFKRSMKVPKFGWQGANRKNVGFVQSVVDKDCLIVSFCSGEARVSVEDVVKVVPLDRGQHVRLKADVKEPKYGWRGQSRDSVGTVLCMDDDGLLRVGFPGASRGWKADPAEMERVEEFQVGDWVRIRPSLTAAKHGLGSVVPGSIGVVYSIRPDNSLLLELNYVQGPWHCEPEEVERVEPFKVGDRVCVKRSVAEPRYAWGGETHHSVGTVMEISSDGLLMIDILCGHRSWKADPADIEKVEDFKVGDWVRVKAAVSSPKYGWEDVTRSSIGVVHSLEEEGDMGVGFCFRSRPFSCSLTDVEKVAPFEVGQELHVKSSVTEPRLGWCGETSATTGKISRIDLDGTLNIKVAGRPSFWRVSPGDVECLSGFEVGDWVRLKPHGVKPSYDWHGTGKDSFAVVHSLSEMGYLELVSCFRKGRWMTHYMDVEKVANFKVGQHVRFRASIKEPRWGWRGCSLGSKGVIIGVHADGEVRVAFPGLTAPWRGDPADLVVEEMFEVGDWVKVKEDVVEPKHGWKSVHPGGIGVVQGLAYEIDNEERAVLVGFCGEQDQWLGLVDELERVQEPFRIGQQVRVKEEVKQPRFGWCGNNQETLGTVISIDADGRLKTYSSASGQKYWMLDPAEVEIVKEKPIDIGDWVRVKSSVSTPAHQWGEVTHASIGIVHKIDDHEDLWVAFCFLDKLWVCKRDEVERVKAFRIGDRVRVKRSVLTPRWGWNIVTHTSRGVVRGIDANGKLRIQFAWQEGRRWIGDPADVELDAD